MSLPVRTLTLSDEDRAELARLLETGSARMAQRARIVLACADPGFRGNSGVAAEMRITADTVRRWRERFAASGAAGLAESARPGRPQARPVLSDAERDQLTRWAACRTTTCQALALRAKIVLACTDGKNNKVIAAELRTTEYTVARWRGGFARNRLDELMDERGPGRPLSIPPGKVGEVVIATIAERPAGAPRWSRASMARRSGLSKSTIGRIWRQAGLKPHLQAPFRPYPDPPPASEAPEPD